MPRNIASTKNAKPSIVNGKMITLLTTAMNGGKSTANNTATIVPESAPTTNSVAIANVHLFAIVVKSLSRRMIPNNSASDTKNGIPTPKSANAI